jgi:transketolase
VEALFVVLADRGFFPIGELETLGRFRSHFVGHPTRKVPGVEQNTGALGHGLPLAVGTALAAKLDDAGFRVFTLLGDGELAEGSNWEAALAGAHYKLDNLTVIIDCNTLQISGRTKDIMNHEPLAEKWAAFGWAVRSVNGHDCAELISALEQPLEPGKPSVIIARTVKGKGIGFMEDVGKWHHGVPSDQEYMIATAELEAALAKLGGVA